MFGVLVVKDAQDKVTYLAAYSGKLADGNHLPGFVPPVFDLLKKDGFYKIGESAIDAVSQLIQKKKTSDEYKLARLEFASARDNAAIAIAAERKNVREGKQRRKVIRNEAEQLSPAVLEQLEQRLAAESIRESYGLKDLSRAVKHTAKLAQARLQLLQTEIEALEDRRAGMSNDLQQRIFSNYTFLNHLGETNDLGSIFRETIFQVPPAGAGECAAPKLLQFAYLNDLTPVALAEFWWGQSPASEIRKHGHFYPACRGKCEPILGHMLRGLATDPNPMLQNPAEGKLLTTVYEDDALMVIDKPPDFLSVPGKNIRDSVWLRIRRRYPEATGPLIVHRLDMSTSGLMLVTKTKQAHKLLQRQFFKRSIRKRYVALLDGEVAGQSGTIDLPLRGDLEDRPRQIVCAEHGKHSRSHWEVIERLEGKTLVHLWPVTGRTHQLRVHCAHPDGLNTAISGDDLYGRPGDRLQLHAASLSFVHPVTKMELSFTVDERFGL